MSSTNSSTLDNVLSILWKTCNLQIYTSLERYFLGTSAHFYYIKLLAEMEVKSKVYSLLLLYINRTALLTFFLRMWTNFTYFSYKIADNKVKHPHSKYTRNISLIEINNIILMLYTLI